MFNYSDSLSLISNELSVVDSQIIKIISSYDNRFIKDFLPFIFSGSKKIRSAFSVLTLKLLQKDISENQYIILAVIEILHNSSLIHDDIIDNSDTRRNNPSLKKLLGNKKAVLFGDFLLSAALQKILEMNNPKITKQLVNSLSLLCNGEINQLFEKNKIPSLDEYILKSEQKTAELFKSSLVCSLLAENNNKYLDFAQNFAKYFGIAFQIRNDIDDIFQKSSVSADFENGIYTAPTIFYSRLYPDKTENISLNNLKTPEILALSNDLCRQFTEKALDLIKDFSDNQYKQTLISLCKSLNKGQNYEI